MIQPPALTVPRPNAMPPPNAMRPHPVLCNRQQAIAKVIGNICI